jgi:hypothetical protein
MKWIKTFESISEIERLCNEYGIENWTINSDGLVDVDGDVYLRQKQLTKIPINFGRVGGDFYCHDNRLTTLGRGVPRDFSCRVGGSYFYFYCDDNQLTKLQGAPDIVLDSFICSNNRLNTLEGAPNRVGGGFNCQINELWTFKGAPEFIGSYFYCGGNKIKEIWNFFEIPKYIDWLNDHDAIRIDKDGEPYVVLDRLNSFLEDIGKQPVRELKNYKTI